MGDGFGRSSRKAMLIPIRTGEPPVTSFIKVCAPTTEVGPKDDFGLKVVDHAREHDFVFKVRS